MPTITVAALQLAFSDDIAENIANVSELVGEAAGHPDEKGRFPKGSVNARVVERLRDIAEIGLEEELKPADADKAKAEAEAAAAKPAKAPRRKKGEGEGATS